MALQEKTVSAGDYGWKSWSNGYVISLLLREESTDVGSNTSRVSYQFTISNTDNNRFTSNGYNWTITIGDQTIAVSNFDFDLSANYTTQTIAAGEVTVAHNGDGTREMPYSVSIPNVQAYTRYGPPAMYLAGSWPLTSIPRWAELTGCPADFTDESNPQISYSNPAGEAASALYGVMAINDTQHIAERALPKTGSAYTFALTEGERVALWNACPESNTLTVTFSVQSTIGGETRSSSQTGTMRIVNGNPVVNPTITEANDAMYALTGDRNTLVRFYSNAAVTIGAGARKGAAIRQKIARNGSRNLADDGVFNAVESGSFSFWASDSRGNESQAVTVTKNLIPYVKLTCEIADMALGTDGKAEVIVQGNCYTGAFGAVGNIMTLQYQWRTQGGSYGPWENFYCSGFADDRYTASFVVSGLDYQQKYVFRVRVGDRIETVTTSEVAISGEPVFDWGKNDFQFHVPVSIMGERVFGYLGSYAGKDFNDLTGNGYYAFDGTPGEHGCSNCPTDVTGLLVVLHFEAFDYQIYLTYNGYAYFRGRYAYFFNWSGWTQFC